MQAQDGNINFGSVLWMSIARLLKKTLKIGFQSPEKFSGKLGNMLVRWLLFSHSVVSDCLWFHGLHVSLSSTITQSLLKLTSIELVMPSNHLILCCLLLLLPSVFPSIRVFSNKLALCIRWSKCYGFSFNISPSNRYTGLISFKID